MSNLNTPISYTNKDFRSIYEELLNLGKQLSHKWDPTITNESDPGIVLIKEKAITADKNNYNIDKNILESFPSTVTQENIARQLFNQLGYKMPWYNAGTGELTLKWIGDDLYMTDVINIPKFTMITDEDNSIVYSTIEDAQINWTTKKYTTTVPVIQGMYVNFNVAGNPIITTSNIDNNNRLYLNDYNIAENGIFITNVDDANIEWTQVPNILLYPSNSYVYEFNIDPSTNLCYLEFPSDYDSLIGSGLNINYILTNGYEGNIKARTLSSFYNDTAVTIGKEKIQLNSENMILYNTDAITDGSNPLNIDQSYNEYKRTVGTFDNLVTLRDYVNAIYNTNLVSNAQVSDRYHDIQTSYQVLTDESGIVNCVNKNIKVGTNNTISYKKVQSNTAPKFANNTYYEYNKSSKQMQLITKQPVDWDDGWSNYYILHSNEEEDLTAYDLRLYLLKSSGKIKTLTDFKNTFELEESNSKRTKEVKQSINDQKCVQHNYKDILKDIPCLFRNIYPVNIKIIPQYKLSDTQQIDVKNNIFRALIESLNSRNIQFSEEPDYDAIYNTIMNADNRIKVIILDDFEYTTYASYWEEENKKFKHVPISEFKDKNIIVANNTTELEKIIKDKDFEYNKEECLYITTDKNNTCYVYKDKKLEPYSDKITSFRTDIIAKSVLAGKTTLFDIDQQFRYVINQTHKKQYTEIDKISTELILAPFGATVTTTVTNIDKDEIPKDLIGTTYIGEGAQAEYTLRDNESLQLYAPAFTTKKSYSNYVKYVIGLKSTNKSEYVIKKLADDEKISENNPVYLYEYDAVNKLNKYVKYTYDKTVTASDGTSGNITKLVNEGKLTVYTKQAIYRIEADEEYKLQEGDYIYFFYKESDEDNAPYVYERYEGIENETDVEKSPVIKANFNIKCNNSGDNLITKFYNQFTNSSGEVFYSDSADSPYQTIASLYGDNDLSGTKQIDMRTINQVFFEHSVGEKYYFITNDIITNETGVEQYKLPLHEITNEDSTKYEYEYILKDDEFFIYINKEKTAYEIAGSGTLIKIYSNEEINSPTVDKIEESIISELGLDSFVDSCIYIDGDVLVREQQIYNLTKGDTLYLTLNENYFKYEPGEEGPKEFKADDGIARITLEYAEKININSIKLYYKENTSDSEDKEINYKSEVIGTRPDTKIVVTPDYIINKFQEESIDNDFKLETDKYATINYADKYNVVNYEPSKYYIEDIDTETSQTRFIISNDEIMNEYDNYYSIPGDKIKQLPTTNLSTKFVNDTFHTYSPLTDTFQDCNLVVSSTDNTPVTPNDWGDSIYFEKKKDEEEKVCQCNYKPIPLKHRYLPAFQPNTYFTSNTLHSTFDQGDITMLSEEPDDWGTGLFYSIFEPIIWKPIFTASKYYQINKSNDNDKAITGYTLLAKKPDDWGPCWNDTNTEINYESGQYCTLTAKKVNFTKSFNKDNGYYKKINQSDYKILNKRPNDWGDGEYYTLDTKTVVFKTNDKDKTEGAIDYEASTYYYKSGSDYILEVAESFDASKTYYEIKASLVDYDNLKVNPAFESSESKKYFKLTDKSTKYTLLTSEPKDWGTGTYYKLSTKAVNFGPEYKTNKYVAYDSDIGEYKTLTSETPPDDWGYGTYYKDSYITLSKYMDFIPGSFYKKENGYYKVVTIEPLNWKEVYSNYYTVNLETPVEFIPFMPTDGSVYKFNIQSGEFIPCTEEDTAWEDENTLYFSKEQCDYSPVQIYQLDSEYPYFSDNGDVVIDNLQYYYFEDVSDNLNTYLLSDILSVLDTYEKTHYFIKKNEVKQIVPFKENTYYIKDSQNNCYNLLVKDHFDEDKNKVDENNDVIEALTLDYEILDPTVHTNLSRINVYKIFTKDACYKVKYDRISEETPAPVFKSSSITSLKGCELKYKSSDSEDVISSLPIINIHDEDSNWKCIPSLNIDSDYNKSQVIKSANSTVTSYIEYSNEDVFKENVFYKFENDQYILLEEQPDDWGTGIYYKGLYNSIQLFYIPNPVYEILLAQPDDWGIGTYYKLENDKYIEVEKAIPFKSNEYYIYKKDNLDLITLLNDDIDITTNVTVQKLGGKNVDITYLDLYGNRKKITLLSFINSKLEDDSISLDAEDNISINLNHDFDKDLKIATASFDKDYYYILPIRNASEKVKYKLSIAGASTDVGKNILKYNLHKPDTQYGKGMQYYLFTVEDNSTKVDFKMNIDGSDNTNIIIYPLVKYKESDMFDKYSIKVEDVINRMQTLDEENQYKYNYIIPTDKLIKDPLEAKTFFDENHICNRFTIAQADMDLTNLGSSLDIINNR